MVELVVRELMLFFFTFILVTYLSLHCEAQVMSRNITVTSLKLQVGSQ
jgi:hypothetical protein